jgi:hypothetical protein
MSGKALAGLALLTAATCGHAAAEDRAAACVGISSDVARLECFDDAFRAANIAIGDQASEVCERILFERLATPATYRRVSAWVADTTAHVEYDAQNQFGALVRNVFSCLYGFDGVSFRYINYDLAPKSVIDRRFSIDKGKTRLDHEKAAITFKRIEDQDNPERDEKFINLCTSALGVGPESRGKVINAPTGGRVVYVEPPAGPFKVGECMVLGGEVTSHRVVR